MDNNFSGTPNNGDYSAPENTTFNADEQYGFSGEASTSTDTASQESYGYSQPVEPTPQETAGYGYSQPQQDSYGYGQTQQSAYDYQSAPYGTPVATPPGNNSFGLLMTFSVIETIVGCCGCGIPSIFGILGCVFSSSANKAYKNGDYTTYKSKKTTTTIMLIIGLILNLLTCCCGFLLGPDFINGFMEGYNEGYSAAASGDIDDLEDLFNDLGVDLDDVDADIDFDDLDVDIDDSDDSDDNQVSADGFVVSKIAKFTLEGGECEFPMPIKTFTSYGFTLEDKYYDEKVPANTYGFYAFYYGEDYYGSLAVYNPTDDEIDAEDGYLSTIYITKMYDEYTPNFVLSTGHTFNSTKEDFVSYFGEPDSLTENDDKSYSTYRWTFGEYSDHLTVEFTGEDVYQISFYHGDFY